MTKPSQIDGGLKEILNELTNTWRGWDRDGYQQEVEILTTLTAIKELLRDTIPGHMIAPKGEYMDGYNAAVDKIKGRLGLCIHLSKLFVLRDNLLPYSSMVERVPYKGLIQVRLLVGLK